MWNIRGSVEESVNTMTTITTHDGITMSLCVLLNNVTNFPVLFSRLDYCDGFTQTFISNFNQVLVLIAHITNEKGFVQITMKSIMVNRYIDVT